MFIAQLSIRFRLHGCVSLKEKRQRLRGLRDKFGQQTNVAVCESALLEAKHEAEYSFVCAANDKATVQGILNSIVQFCKTGLDAEIYDDFIQWL